MRESQRHNGDGEDANGDVDVEDPLPTDSVGDIAADRRTDDAGQTKDRTEKTLPAPAIGGGQQVADDGEGGGGDRTSAETLEGAEEDQPRHPGGQAGDLNAKKVKRVGALGEATERRAEDKDSHTGDEEPFATIQIAKLADDRDRNGRGEQV